MDPSELPQAVTDAVKKLYPAGKIKSAESSTSNHKTVYEMTVTVDKKSHSMTVAADGTVKEDKASGSEGK